MPIIYPKERASGPFLTDFVWRLDEVEDDGNPVFVVVADEALVGGDGVGVDYSVWLFRDFCGSSERVEDFFVVSELQLELVVFSFGGLG